jgi:phosphatidylinositol alpha-mannosyltransferase
MSRHSPGKKSQLKVALVYDDSLDGHEGVAHQVKLIGSWLSARGHVVSYLCGQTKVRSYSGGKIYSLSKNVAVRFNGNRLSIPLPARTSAIQKALDEVKPDVLHVQMPHSPFLAQKIVSQAGMPTVGTFHIYPANRVASIGSRLLKLMYGGGLKKFDEIVSVSLAAQGFAKHTFGINSKVVPNAVDLARLRSNTSNKDSTVVFLGRLVERKGCAQLIAAFAAILPAVPDAKLIIGGDGPQRAKLESQVAKLGILDRVTFAGFIAEEAKADFLAQASVACFPSLFGESFGIVLIEAMAAGSGCVIAGNNPGYASVMAPQPELLVDPNKTDDFAAKLALLLSDKTRREMFSSWQKQYVKVFDINIVGAQLEETYVRAIANHDRKRHN